MRATITGGPEGLEIVIPARRQVVPLLFLGIWLAGWLVGELAAIELLFSRRPDRPEAFLLIWLIFWTAGGSVIGYLWLWMLAGKERILMGSSALRMKREVLGLGPTHTYELFRIRNLRVASPAAGARDARTTLGISGLAGGLVAFEYEGKTIRFGAALDQLEAHAIAERMRQRYSFPESSAVA
jgi:hypothetical protein